MKKLLYILPALFALVSCHEPQYIPQTADRQGLTSLTAIISSGKYAGHELSKIEVDEKSFESGNLVFEIPYYYPETSEESTLSYMSELRVQAELQPNYSISPGLGLMDLTEEHCFTLRFPNGTTRNFTLNARRVKPKACSLLSFMIEDYKVSGIIYEDKSEVVIPYLEDLSSVKVSGQVSPHATLSKISGKTYSITGKYNLNTGATITVLAGNGTTSKTYTVAQRIPELEPMGMNVKSIKQLFNQDAYSICGLPKYDVLTYTSLAGLGSEIIVGIGGQAPVRLDAYTGKNLGTMNIGSAVADALTNDAAGNLLMVNFAQGGASAETVNIWRTKSVDQTPTLFYSFTNPIDVPIGHRIKVFGDIDTQAVIVLTAEGVDGVTVTAKSVALFVNGGSVTSTSVNDFLSGSPFFCGWGSAPVHFGTVVPASLTPDVDGWYTSWYEGNADADGNYLLHHVSASGADTIIGRMGNWGTNNNCLDCKAFNGVNYMTLFTVSHFPCWGLGPMLYLYNVSDPASATLLVKNESIDWFQTADYASDLGASGDVVLVPTTDGYRLLIYYYDHHCHTIGAYVADCFKTE